MARQKLSKQEKAWIKYDVGNSAYILLATTLGPLYFKNIIAPGSSAVVYWGYAETIASLIMAIAMPFLGSLADLQGNKKKFYLGTVCTGALACLCWGIPSNIFIFLGVYILSTTMFSTSLVFYDAFLIDATTEDRYDEVSAQGYAWGYIGSTVPFLVSLGLVLGGPSIGLPQEIGMRIAFAITAIWWFAFSLPLIKNVKQLHFKPRTPHIIKDSLVGLGHTVKNIAKDKPLRLFIISYFFYIDGINTIIKMSTSYGADLGLGMPTLVLALLVTQFVAFPSAIVYGRLGTRFGAKTMLLIGIVAYSCIVFFAAYFMKSALEFWILAISVGLFQGGVQALSRAEYGRLIPQEHASEYYGFYDIFGKFSAIIGTSMVSTIALVTQENSIGVISLEVLFILGLVFLWKVPNIKKKRHEEELGAEA